MNTKVHTEINRSICGYTISVEFHADYDIDHLWLGDFSNEWSAGAIERRPRERNAYKFWIPTPGGQEWESYYKDTRAWYTKRGYSKHEAHTETMKHRQRDYKLICDINLGELTPVGIKAIITHDKTGLEIGNSSLWGYLDYSYPPKEEWNPILSEAIYEARQNIKQFQAVQC